MSDVYGVVQRINTRQAGKGTAYNVQMDDGSWFGYGFNKPKFGQGATVSFDVIYRGQYANVNVDTVVVHDNGNSSNNANNNSNPNNGGNNQPRGQQNNFQDKDNYWKEREKRDIEWQRHQREVVQPTIQYQGSRNAAINLVNVLLQNDCLALPQKKAEKMDAVIAVVDQLTDKFENDLSSPQPNEPQQQQQGHGGNGFDDDIPFN